jgi:hypothetical protein
VTNAEKSKATKELMSMDILVEPPFGTILEVVSVLV